MYGFTMKRLIGQFHKRDYFGVSKSGTGIALVLIILFVGCKPQEKEPIPSPVLSFSQLSDKFYHEFNLDSSFYYNEKCLKESSHLDIKEKIERLNLHIRLAKLQGQDSLCIALSDSVWHYLETLKDTTSLRYITWLNGMGANYLSTHPDTARYFLKKSISLNENTVRDPEQRMRSYRSLAFLSVLEGDYAEALPLFRKNDTIAKTWEEIPPYFFAQVYNDLGYFYIIQTNEQGIYEAARYYEKAYNILTQNLPSHPQIIETGYTLSYHQFRMGKHANALSILRNILTLCRQTGNDNRQIDAYKLMGNVLREQGETDPAMESLKAASYLCEQKKVIDPYVYNDLALVYSDKKQYPEAISELRKTLTMYQPDQLFDIGSAYYNIGCFYYDFQKYDSAIFYLKKIPVFQEHKDYPWLKCQQKYMLGLTYSRQNKILDAKKELLFAEKLADSIGMKKAWQAAEIYGGFTELAKKENKLAEALAFNQKAIQALSFLFSENDITKNPELRGLVSPRYMLKSLIIKADLLEEQYQISGSEKDLELCLNTRELAQDLIDSMRITYNTSGSKLSLMNESFSVYEKSIRNAERLYQKTQNHLYIEKAFLFAERSKATLLSESLQTHKASTLAGIPDSVLNKVQTIQAEIGFLENLKYTTKTLNSDSLQNVITKTREESQKIKEAIKAEYPDFSRINGQTTLTDIGRIQRKLEKEHSVMVEFFLGDTIGYIFCLEPKSIKMYPFKIDSTLTNQITTLRTQLSERKFINEPEKSWTDFISSASFIYKQLLAPVFSTPPPRMTIIPDGLLGYIPFEVLLTQAPSVSSLNYGELSYLFVSTRLTYAYSGMIWSDELTISPKSLKPCVSFAPVFKEDATLATLTYTREEAESVAKNTDGNVYYDEAATETRFKQEAPQYRIIHLATHALINDENVLDLKLAFAPQKEGDDGFLYVYELFGMRLNAQLAVLSACNTGYGKLQRGEGVMSLARGFSQAGVPSVVMSLWTAQDKSTGALMNYFYHELAEEKSKDEALRQAKLAYLSNASPLTTHPYFWAAFVLTGDNTPIQFSYPFYVKITFFLLLVLAAVSLFLLRKKFPFLQKFLSKDKINTPL